MKNYFFSVAIAIALLPMAFGQIKGLDNYKRVRNYEQIDANPGMKFYVKGYRDAGIVYSCYRYTEPDEFGNTVWLVDGCEITTEQGEEVYNELITVLKANELEVGDFDPEQSEEEFDLSDVKAALSGEGPMIYSVYKVGAGHIFFIAEPYEVKLVIKDRRYRWSLF
jgi:hypothetical protein